MNTQSIIETTGSITKVELLSTYDEHVLPGTVVLTNLNPFPGFRGKEGTVTGKSFYLILMYRYFPEKLERLAKMLTDQDLIECCSSIGEIVIQNKLLPCIRLKRLKSDHLLPLIQDFYKRNEIKFLGYRGFYHEAKIKIFKHFKIIELADGLYRDLHEGAKFYIRMPVQLNLKLFNHLTKRVKEHMINPNFDAAFGVVNRFNGPEDVIRIYDNDITFGRAYDIRKAFWHELRREKILLTGYAGTLSGDSLNH